MFHKSDLKLDDECVLCCKYGKLKTLKELLEQKEGLVPTPAKLIETRKNNFLLLLKVAVQYGHLDIIKWFIVDKKVTVKFSLLLTSIENGYIEIVKWFVSDLGIGSKRTQSLLFFAVENGRFEIVKWLHDNFNIEFTDSMLKVAHDKLWFDVEKYIRNEMIISGLEFNEKYNMSGGRTLFRKLTQDVNVNTRGSAAIVLKEKCKNFNFTDGLNIDCFEFDPCIGTKGGFCFAMKDDIQLFYKDLHKKDNTYCTYMRDVTIPDDAKVFVTKRVIKSDKIILGKAYEIDDIFNKDVILK